MSDDNKFTGNGRNEKQSSEIRVPSRNWLLWILILGCIPLLMIFHDRRESRYAKISRQQLISLVESNEVHEGVINYNPQSSVLNEVTGWYYGKKDPATGAQTPIRFKVKTRVTPD